MTRRTKAAPLSFEHPPSDGIAKRQLTSGVANTFKPIKRWLHENRIKVKRAKDVPFFSEKVPSTVIISISLMSLKMFAETRWLTG
jgi:hypothetical protein